MESRRDFSAHLAITSIISKSVNVSSSLSTIHPYPYTILFAHTISSPIKIKQAEWSLLSSLINLHATNITENVKTYLIKTDFLFPNGLIFAMSIYTIARAGELLEERREESKIFQEAQKIRNALRKQQQEHLESDMSH
jgi:hypothetical protein